MPDGGASFFAAVWGAIKTAGTALLIEAIGTAIIGKLFGGNEGQSGGLKDVVTNNVLPRRVIYGTREVGGQLCYLETNGGDENHWLHMIVAVSGHPVEDITWVKLNEEIIDVSGLAGSNDLHGPGSYSIKNTATGNAGQEWGVSSATTKDAWGKIIKVNGWADANTTYVPQTYRDNPSTAPSFVQEDITRANFISSWLSPQGTVNTDQIVNEFDYDPVGNPLWKRSTHKLTNCAYIYIRIRYNKDRPSQTRIPKMKFTVKGKKLYDPRKDSSSPVYDSSLGSGHDIADPTTWEWSENWALPVLDYLINPEYGLSMNSDFTGEDKEIRWDTFAQAAEDSDDMVAHGDSTNIVNPSLLATYFPNWQPASGSNWELPRYTLNAVITTDQTPISIVEGMLNEGAGFLAYAQAEYSLYAGKYRAPASANDILEEDDLAGPINVSTANPRANTFNKVGGTYIRQYLDDSQVDFYPIYEPTDFGLVNPTESDGVTNPYEVEDGEEIIKEFDFPYCLYEPEAQRKARIYLERNRQALTVTAKFNLNALKYSVGDIVYLNIERLGWTLDAQDADLLDPNYSGLAPKQFMILGATVNEDFTVDLTLREEASAIYDWNEGDAFLTDPSPNRTLNLIKRTDPLNDPSWETSAQPITSDIVTLADGGTNTKTTLKWLAPEIYNVSEGTGAGRNQISHYELQYGIVTNAGAVNAVDRVTEWINYGSNIPNDPIVDLQGPINIYGLTNNTGERYEFRVRAASWYGKLSNWVYFMDSTFAPSDGNGYDVGIDIIAPGNDFNISATTDINAIIEITVTPDSSFDDTDVAYFEILTAEEDAANGSSATAIKTFKIASPIRNLGSVDSIPITITPDTLDVNRYIWVRLIDTSGNAGSYNSGTGTLGKALPNVSVLTMSASSSTFKYDANGALVGPSSINFSANRQNITQNTSWFLQDSEGSLVDFLNFQKQGEISFTYDAWDDDIYAPCIVQQPDGVYRMYYTGYDLSSSSYGPCTATSTDLVNWIKPILNKVSYGGNTDNNIVIAYTKLTLAHYDLIDGIHYLLLRNTNSTSCLVYYSTNGVDWTFRSPVVFDNTSHGSHVEPKCIVFVNNKWRIYYSEGHFDDPSIGEGLRSIGYYESATDDINSTFTDQGLVPEWTAPNSSNQYYDLNVYEFDGIHYGFVPKYDNGGFADLLGPLYMWKSTDGMTTWDYFGLAVDFGANGEFDDSLITTARPILLNGTWHLIYGGSPELHFYPERPTTFGRATSSLLTSTSDTEATLLESTFAGITNNDYVKVTAEADGLSDLETIVQVEDGVSPPFTGTALNLGRKLNDLNLWYDSHVPSTANPLTSPWGSYTLTGAFDPPVWPTVFSVTTDSVLGIHSELVHVDNTRRYRFSVWLKQPSGNRLTDLFITQYDANKNFINGTNSAATGWTAKSNNHFIIENDITVPTGWTLYTLEFGGNATAEFDTVTPGDCQYIALGAYVGIDPGAGTSTNIQFNDFHVVEVPEDGTAGADGYNTATLTAYKWVSGAAPTDDPGDLTYTFSTADWGITIPSNGWYDYIPASPGTGYDLYAVSATAYSDTSTDNILAANWTSPSKISRDVADGTDGTDGTDGDDGLNVATVYIYQRTTVDSAPAVPSSAATVEYTFATGGITGLDNGWDSTLPANTGSKPYLWTSIATASSATATDTIPTSEWTTPELLSIDAIVTGNALNLGRRMDTLSLWYNGYSGSAPNISSPWETFVDTSNPVWDTGLTITDTSLNFLFSELIPVVNTNKYRLSVWLKQPSGTGLTSLMITQYDSNKNIINGTTSAATGWVSKSSNHFNAYDSITVPTGWTLYTFEFGGDATAEFDTNCKFVSLGAYVAEANSATIYFNDYNLQEIGAGGATWHTDSGAPSGALGVVGDLYLRTDTSAVYEKTGATTWTLIISSLDGSDGVTTYTWVKYADTSDGSGLSNSPDGKSYVGLAYNKTTSTESTNPVDYEWSLIQGPSSALVTMNGWKSPVADTMGGWDKFSGTLSNATMTYGEGSYGERVPIYRVAGDGTSSSWYHAIRHYFELDPDIGVVSYVWVKATGADHGGIYIGWDEVEDFAGTRVSNPYSMSNFGNNLANFDTDKWYLAVGVIQPEGDSTASGLSGIYDPVTGAKIYDGNDYRVDSSFTSRQYFRMGYYGAGAYTSSQYSHFTRPVVYRLGEEPNILDILQRAKNIITDDISPNQLSSIVSFEAAGTFGDGTGDTTYDTYNLGWVEIASVNMTAKGDGTVNAGVVVNFSITVWTPGFASINWRLSIDDGTTTTYLNSSGSAGNSLAEGTDPPGQRFILNKIYTGYSVGDTLTLALEIDMVGEDSNDVGDIESYGGMLEIAR